MVSCAEPHDDHGDGRQLMRYKPSERISASASLQHATFKNSPLKAISKIGKALGNISEVGLALAALLRR